MKALKSSHVDFPIGLVILLNLAEWVYMLAIRHEVYPLAAGASVWSLALVAVSLWQRRQGRGAFWLSMLAMFAAMLMMVDVGRVRS